MTPLRNHYKSSIEVCASNDQIPDPQPSNFENMEFATKTCNLFLLARSRRYEYHNLSFGSMFGSHFVISHNQPSEPRTKC